MTWQLVFTKQAQKDAKKLAAAGLRSKAEQLLTILAADPYQHPPPFEKLIGDLAGATHAGSTSNTALSIKYWKTSGSLKCFVCGRIMNRRRAAKKIA